MSPPREPHRRIPRHREEGNQRRVETMIALSDADWHLVVNDLGELVS